MPWARSKPEIMGPITVARLRPGATTRAALRWHDGPRRRVRQAFVVGLVIGQPIGAIAALVTQLALR
jgi:hypothetical protein